MVRLRVSSSDQASTRINSNRQRMETAPDTGYQTLSLALREAGRTRRAAMARHTNMLGR